MRQNVNQPKTMKYIPLPDDIINDRDSRIFFHCKNGNYNIFFVYNYTANELIISDSNFRIIKKEQIVTSGGLHFHSSNVHNHYTNKVIFNICYSDIHRESNIEGQKTYYQFYETEWYSLNLDSLELKTIVRWEKSEIRQVKSINTPNGILWLCGKQNPLKDEKGNFRIGCPMNFGYSLTHDEKIPEFKFTKPFTSSIYDFDFLLSQNIIYISSVLGSGWDNAYLGKLILGGEEIQQKKLDIKKTNLHFFCSPTISIWSKKLLLTFKTDTQESPQKKLNLTYSHAIISVADDQITIEKIAQ